MISHLSLGDVPHDVLPKQTHFRTLRDELQHDLTLLVVVHGVVLVVADLLKQEAVARGQTHVHIVVCEGVLQESVFQVASEDLDDGPDHFSDLVVEESLALEEKVDELHRIRVFSIRNLVGLSVDVHVGVSLKLQHEANGLCLMRPDFLGEVVIFLASQELSE